MNPYKHEPLTDFSVIENKKTYEEALTKVEAELAADYPLMIDDEHITTKARILSYNPAKKTEVIRPVSKASNRSC